MIRTHLRPCPAPLVALVAALLLTSSRAVISQEVNPPESAGLRQSLETLERELEAELRAMRELEASFAGEIEALHGSRAELARELLDVELERLSNAERLATLREQESERSARAIKLGAGAKSLTAALRTAAAQLRVHLRSVPGSDETIDRLAELGKALATDDEAPSQSAAESMLELFDKLAAAHDQATRWTVRTVRMANAAGRKEEVQLLSLGHVRHAYQTPGGAVGLALASPEGVEGYRWTERVPEDLADDIRDSIETARSGNGGWAWFPLDPTGRTEAASIERRRGVWEWLRSGGGIMIPLAGIAAIATLLVLERIAFLYGANRRSSRIAGAVIAACRGGQIDGALRLCASDRGVVARVLATCISRHASGIRAMEDAIQEQLLHELPRVRRFLGGLAVLAAIAPLLGLLGTVTGIIQTFGVVEAFGNANSSLMSGGISEALITTATGLVIAVPILAVHSVLRGRSDALLADSEKHAATLLGLLSYEVPVSTDHEHAEPRGTVQSTDEHEEDRS